MDAYELLDTNGKRVYPGIIARNGIDPGPLLCTDKLCGGDQRTTGDGLVHSDTTPSSRWRAPRSSSHSRPHPDGHHGHFTGISHWDRGDKEEHCTGATAVLPAGAGRQRDGDDAV